MPGEWGDGPALDTNTSLLLSDSLENISRSGYFEIQVPIVLLGLFEAPWPVQCSGSPPLSCWVVTLISVNTGCTDLTYNYTGSIKRLVGKYVATVCGYMANGYILGQASRKLTPLKIQFYCQENISQPMNTLFNAWQWYQFDLVSFLFLFAF